MTGRRVLITGAGGFVGSALSDGFAAIGWDVVAVDRAFDAGADDGRGAVRRIVTDLAEGMPDGLPAVDVVVHGAWVTTAPEDMGMTRAEYLSANLEPLEVVLRWVARTGPAAFVFLSSSGVFAADDAAGRPGLADTDEPTSDSPYAVAKRTGEALVAAAEGSTAAHVVRLGYLYGPGEVARPSRVGLSAVARFMAAARDGRALEIRADDPRREWTYAPDLAGALALLVGEPALPGTVHLCSPHVCHDRELARAVLDVVPGSELVSVTAEGRVKPPMVASELELLRDFRWTTVADGLRAIVGTEVVA